MNIREANEDLDLLGDSLPKSQQSPIIVRPLVNGKHRVLDGSRRVRAGRTCFDIEAIIYAKLGWPPVAHTAEEAAEAAVVVGFWIGLDSQIQRDE